MSVSNMAQHCFILFLCGKRSDYDECISSISIHWLMCRESHKCKCAKVICLHCVLCGFHPLSHHITTLVPQWQLVVRKVVTRGEGISRSLLWHMTSGTRASPHDEMVRNNRNFAFLDLYFTYYASSLLYYYLPFSFLLHFLSISYGGLS